MAIYQYRCEQTLRTTPAELWSFISDPSNLKRITPPYMGFDITSGELPGKMYPGMIITYKVSPLLGISMKWVTEITHVRDGSYFVDEQRMGPYTMWHHQHIIREAGPGEVTMEDIVSYIPPMGWLGRLANRLIIRHRLKEIFEYRRKVFTELYGPETTAHQAKR